MRLLRPWRRWLTEDKFAPVATIDRVKWSETLLIPIAAMALAWLVRPHDPLLAQASFPWLWFAPTLVALRYGVVAGLIAAILLVGEWFVVAAFGIPTGELPRVFFFGAVLLVLVCGEFSDVWRDRNLRMDETNLYVTERLSRLTKRHLLLNLSHDRIEQEMLARPGSLRDALARLRNIVIGSGATSRNLPGVDGLLELLVQYVNIDSAVLHGVAEHGDDFALGPALGWIGDPAPLAAADELLTLAMERRGLVHIATDEVSFPRISNQLVVAPLIASDDSIIAVLAISKLPFFSLDVENLQMLAAILAYYADSVRTAPDAQRLRDRLPGMPVMFAEEMARMARLQQKLGITSHIVVMTFAGADRESIPGEFLRIKRGLDLYWQTALRGNPVVVVLMPFASSSAREGFLLRIESWLRTRFAGDFLSLDIKLRAIDFAVEEPLAALAGALDE